MIKSKFNLLLIGLSLTVCSTYSKNLLNESQAKNYISHLIENLFVSSNHSGIYATELKNFTTDTTALLLKRFGKYSTIFSWSKVYNDKDLQEGVMASSVSFIEAASNKFAVQVFEKNYSVSYIHRSEVINNVTKEITDEVLAIFTKSAFVNTGALTNYFGVPLFNKVNEITKKEIKRLSNNSSNNKPVTSQIYKTSECPVCFEDFSNSVKSIYLNCGHGFCSNCLRSWYHEKGNKVDCPLCRNVIYISDYSDILWQTA